MWSEFSEPAVLDPKFYGSVMTHAATVMDAVFRFGLKLLP